MTRGQGNRPDRRVAPIGSVPEEMLRALDLRLRYEGASTHKLHPGNYGFIPPVNPRPSRSVCDDLRVVLRAEAIGLFRAGIKLAMVSAFDADSTPKYVWSIDPDNEVYEAKTKPPEIVYHGYRIKEDERDMRRYILAEWKMRCG